MKDFNIDTFIVAYHTSEKLISFPPLISFNEVGRDAWEQLGCQRGFCRLKDLILE